MRQTFILIIFILNACLLSAQVTITREGTTINNTTSGFWEGLNISRSVPAKVSVLNNSITSVNASGYLLQAGDEAPLSTNNNIDGAVLTGNRLTWNGTDAASITHGMFIGYNINYTVRYNYLDKTPYGILFKSGTDGGTNMTYSSGYGAAYNIVKNSKLSLRMKGINGVQVYNNTFYSNQRSGSVILIDANHDRTTPAPSTGAKIKNNIFYTVYQIPNISIESACLSNFESDYNLFFCESGTPVFTVSGSQKTFAQWQAMGYDLHSVVVNPNFNNTTDFVPGSRLNNGTNLGTTWQTGLSTSASWVAGSAPATANQNGTWQVGARIYSEVTAPPPPIPVYSASSVENATPSVVEMTYNLSLANIVPAISAFSVRVNSTARNINSVAVSGTKVLLTLSSPVVNGNTVTVAYTKPAVNPLQTAAGGQAATITAQAVTNRVNPVIVNPVFVSAAIGDATPSRIDLSYNLSLANIIPAASSFAVRVNSVARAVNSVTISGTVVLLTLASPVVYGDVVTLAYTKPASNPLQTPAGGQAITITAQSVTNKVSQVIVNPVYVSSSVENATPSVVEMTYNSTLANIVPAVSAFSVMVNSTARNVNSVTISGTKVLLTLAGPVVNGNAVTVAYTKPAASPLQTTAGGQAATITAQAVTNRVNPVIVNPVFVSAAIGDATPSRIDLSYNLSLANIIPAASSFAVRVNSVARAVNSVTISGTAVLLTLASTVVYGDVVTVAYTKPASNPLQTSSGGQAATISAQPVTNKIAPPVPVYVSSAIENAAPAVITMTYNLSLAAKVPAASAFSVLVNSVARNISSVSVSGTKVMLTLASPVIYGDVVTIAYTRPSTNPLQTNSGAQAATISAKAVTNGVAKVATPVVNTAPVVVINSPPSALSGFVAELDATGSFDANKDNLTYNWVVPANIAVSSTIGSKIEFLSPVVNSAQTVEFKLNISDGKVVQSKSVKVEILPYEPDLEVAEVVSIEASDFQSPNYPYNIIDGNIGTMWSANGDNQWLVLELKEPFSVEHVMVSFQPGQKKESYFDVMGSADSVTWEPILTKSASCAFSGDLQVFDFPPSKAGVEFNFVKFVGHKNSVDSWNHISEFKIFGYKHRNPTSYEEQVVKLYPNPAREFVNIRIDDSTLNPDFIRVISLSGRVLFEQKVDPGILLLRLPIDLERGVYIVQLGTGDLTLFTQKLVVNI